MIGITLHPEQIQRAPPEVRRWLQQQMLETFRLDGAPVPLHPQEPQLVGCSVAEVQNVLGVIQGALPAVNVLFELAREPVMAAGHGIRALLLNDMMRHAQLQSPLQVVLCLQMINAALQRVRNDENAMLAVADEAGHCLVADTTAQSVLAVWQHILGVHELKPKESGLPIISPETKAGPPEGLTAPQTAI